MKIKNGINKGFTLIELLIVIALLGALAVGLLASIDPFEQLKKGNDTSVRNMVSEVYNASIRTYASQGVFPWNLSNQVAKPLDDATMTSAPEDYIGKIVAAGELKSDFVNLAGTGNLNSILLTSTAAINGEKQTTVSVCYKPGSKSFQKDPNTKYQSNGELSTGCPDATGVNTNCYWCVK